MRKEEICELIHEVGRECRRNEEVGLHNRREIKILRKKFDKLLLHLGLNINSREYDLQSDPYEIKKISKE